MRNELAIREKELLNRLKVTNERKKNALTAQLQSISDVIDNCDELCDTVSSLIEAGMRENDENAGMYMVASAHMVQRRSIELQRDFQSLEKSPAATPDITCKFNKEDLINVQKQLKTFGWLSTDDYPPVVGQAEGKDSYEVKGYLCDDSSNVEDKEDRILIPLSLTLNLVTR
jgi:hypothetical protein